MPTSRTAVFYALAALARAAGLATLLGPGSARRPVALVVPALLAAVPSSRASSLSSLPARPAIGTALLTAGGVSVPLDSAGNAVGR